MSALQSLTESLTAGIVKYRLGKNILYFQTNSRIIRKLDLEESPVPTHPLVNRLSHSLNTMLANQYWSVLGVYAEAWSSADAAADVLRSAADPKLSFPRGYWLGVRFIVMVPVKTDSGFMLVACELTPEKTVLFGSRQHYRIKFKQRMPKPSDKMLEEACED